MTRHKKGSNMYVQLESEPIDFRLEDMLLSQPHTVTGITPSMSSATVNRGVKS